MFSVTNNQVYKIQNNEDAIFSHIYQAYRIMWGNIHYKWLPVKIYINVNNFNKSGIWKQKIDSYLSRKKKF